MSVSLDSVDRRLLIALQENSSRPTAELAAFVGISQSPCWRRLHRLKEAGVIEREVAVLNRQLLGWSMQVFAHVKLSAHGRANVDEFTNAVTAHPQVVECHILMGSVDCLLRIVARDVADFEEFFFKHLSTLPAVQDVNSMVSLKEVKTAGLPMP